MGAMSDYDETTGDPCRAGDTSSDSRAAAFVLLFIAMFGFAAFAIETDSFTGTLVGSILGYTAAVMLYSFARNRNAIQPYLFTCPVVVRQYPRLLIRHAAFLAVLIVFVLITAKSKLHHPEPKLPSSGRDTSPSFLVVAIPLMALALTEILTNRALLERAHNERFGEPSEPDDSESALSILGRD